MTDYLNMLADSDGDIGKLVFGVVALIIWGISALASGAKKRQEQAKRRQVFEQIARGGARAAPPPPPPPLPTRPGARPAKAKAPLAPMRSLAAAPASARLAPPPAPRRGKSKGQPPARTWAPPPLTRPNFPPAPAAPAPAFAEPRPAAAANAKIPTVDARALRRWLTPATMRSQFMLTEVLQPPLALRAPRE